MSKITQSVNESRGWTAISKIGVPVIVAFLVTGVPAAAVWAWGVSAKQLAMELDLRTVTDAVKQMRMDDRSDATATTKLREDVSGLKQDVASVLRSLARMEGQIDRLPQK